MRRLKTRLAAVAAITPLALAASLPAPFAQAQMFPAAPNPFAAPREAARTAPLKTLTPVTDATLAKPADADWLMWRRTYNGWGYSPLDQIDRDNVKGLRMAWSWALPPGPTEVTPLVHDGVLFVQGFGDGVDALNAANGDLLWRYKRPLSAGARATVKKSMAIYGDNLLLATSDRHVVALDAKTGKPAWDVEVPGRGNFGGAMLVADGKLILSATNCVTFGCYIVGLDARTGRQLWRFNTVAQPGEPGGDTWNGLPADERYGGSSWTGGSYDPETKLVYWGVGQPYPWNSFARGTSPQKPGQSNELLYTNNTLALDPDTGKLAWHFSHLPNDNWDMDYVFEREIIPLKVDGKERKVVLTAGKIAVLEGLDAKTGEFLYAHDMGLQNIVQSIDPKTGKKTINPAVIPEIGKTVLICPHPGGARSFNATAYNPVTRTLFMPLQEHCADLTAGPRAPGERTAPSKFVLRFREGSDGKVGRLDAVDLEAGKSIWSFRERAPQSTAALPTGGGLVFEGSMDRWFRAFDDRTGQELWRTRLSDTPNAFPITYSVDGKQYVAVATGSGSPYTASWGNMFPEIQNPQPSGATLWVFALPD